METRYASQLIVERQTAWEGRPMSGSARRYSSKCPHSNLEVALAISEE